MKISLTTFLSALTVLVSPIFYCGATTSDAAADICSNYDDGFLKAYLARDDYAGAASYAAQTGASLEKCARGASSSAELMFLQTAAELYASAGDAVIKWSPSRIDLITKDYTASIRLYNELLALAATQTKTHWFGFNNDQLQYFETEITIDRDKLAQFALNAKQQP